MTAESPEIRERWTRWLVERNQRGLRVGLVGIATLFPAFGVLIMTTDRPLHCSRPGARSRGSGPCAS